MENAIIHEPDIKQKAPNRKLLFLVAASLIVWVVLYEIIQPLSELITYDLLGLTRQTRLAMAVEFFIYEAPKVLLLLTLIVFAVGIVRSFFSPERTRKMLAGKREAVGNVLAALLGVVTPFCSCSAVPLFIGFVEAGIPLGVTFSFLIAAPMINEVALVLLFGLFGWEIALIYASTGLLIAMIAGFVIGRLKLEKWVEPWVYEIKVGGLQAEESSDLNGRIMYGLTAVKDIVSKVWPFILLGIAAGAGIHGYVPENFLASFMGREAWWAVPASIILGVPMYSNAAGIVPIVQALIGKGAALGTALAFMMAVIALSLPEAIILRKVLTWKLIAVFFGVVACGILVVGYLFNAIM